MERRDWERAAEMFARALKKVDELPPPAADELAGLPPRPVAAAASAAAFDEQVPR
jgi:hypothetical protein